MIFKSILSLTYIFFLTSTLSIGSTLVTEPMPSSLEESVVYFAPETKALNKIINNKIKDLEMVREQSKFLLEVKDLPGKYIADLKKCITYSNKGIVTLKRLKTTKYSRENFAKEYRAVLIQALRAGYDKNFNPINSITDIWNWITGNTPPSNIRPPGDCNEEQSAVTNDCLRSLEVLLECGSISPGEATALENMCDMKGMAAKSLCDSANFRGEPFYGQILVAELSAQAACREFENGKPGGSQFQTSDGN